MRKPGYGQNFLDNDMINSKSETIQVAPRLILLILLQCAKQFVSLAEKALRGEKI